MFKLLMKKAAGSIFSFFGGLSLKAWLYLFLVAFYLGSCWYFDHRGYTKGILYSTYKYNQGAQKQIEKQQKENDRNAQDAIKQEKHLSSQLTTLQSEKDSLEKQLEQIKQSYPVTTRHLNDTPKKKDKQTTSSGTDIATCVKPDPKLVHNLQAAIDKANK